MPRLPSGQGPDGPEESHPEPGLVERSPNPPRRTGRASSHRTIRLAAALALAAVAVGALVAYRHHHRQRVLTLGIARARDLARPDTYAGWRDAAQVLEPLVTIDPLEAGSARALALAMLAADYRDAAAGREAERLLAEPERSDAVPPVASLARAALALGKREAGTAVTHVSRAGGGALGKAFVGRLALLAGNVDGAIEALSEGVAADSTLPAALAAQGDALRRAGRSEAARTAYAAALVASPRHPRAAYGMAKLALSGKARAEEAIPALDSIVQDRVDTPANERARAALHLAALLGRAGDRAAARRALEAVDLSGPDRVWLERAAAEEEVTRGAYRVIDRAPPALQSASDDDPYVPPPPPPPPPEPRPPTVQDQARKIVSKKQPPKQPAKQPAKKTTAKAKPASKGTKAPAKGASRPPSKGADPARRSP